MRQGRAGFLDKIYNCVEDLVLHLSLPGFSHFSRRRGAVAWFWLLAGFIGLWLTLLQVADVLWSYWSYEVITRVRSFTQCVVGHVGFTVYNRNEVKWFVLNLFHQVWLEDQARLQLPSVAFCPFIKVSCAGLSEAIRLVREPHNLEILCEMQQLNGCIRHQDPSATNNSVDPCPTRFQSVIIQVFYDARVVVTHGGIDVHLEL